MPFTSLALTAAAVLYLVTGYARAPKTAPYPAYGFAGLAIIIAAEAALFLEVRLVVIYFTPLAWTGYILAVDAAVYRLRRRSVKYLVTSADRVPVFAPRAAPGSRRYFSPHRTRARGINSLWRIGCRGTRRALLGHLSV